MTAENPKRNLKIAIVAGEKSGDELGGPLMENLKSAYPSIDFIGVGGEKMISAGLVSQFDMNEIAVMGIIEPLLKLRKLIGLRKGLKNFILNERPDLFIGIDSPDFNLPIARLLKKKLNIKTVQYVSPSVWAWRKGRIKTMEKSVDSVLTIFPFEESAYSGSNIKVSYVGHPLSYEISMTKEQIDNKISNSIALLPGSRRSEVLQIGDLMIKAARILKAMNSKYEFFMPLSNKDHLNLFNEDLEEYINISYGDAKDVLKKVELSITTSGTATLESVLSFTPCLTVYKTNWLSYLLIKPLLNIDTFSLPNLIMEKKFLPELLQGDVTIQNIVNSVQSILDGDRQSYENKFLKIKESLMAGGAEKASNEILRLIN